MVDLVSRRTLDTETRHEAADDSTRLEDGARHGSIDEYRRSLGNRKLSLAAHPRRRCFSRLFGAQDQTRMAGSDIVERS